MKILTTFPGHYGDILWALPTVRAISEAVGEPVDFATAHTFGKLNSIIQQQPYIRDVFEVKGWDLKSSSPADPRTPSSEALALAPVGGPAPLNVNVEDRWDRVVDLGYRGWPKQLLPLETADCGGVAVDLGRPWIQVAGPKMKTRIAFGFTDEYFELKVGLAHLLILSLGLQGKAAMLIPNGSRWFKETAAQAYSFDDAARVIRDCDLFVGCLSSLAVLAAAMGKPRVLVEPQVMRHHEIFQHWDTELVKGNDGKPTFDARHVADAIRRKVKEIRG